MRRSKPKTAVRLRVPSDPDERHAAFFDAVGPRLLGHYTDGGARSAATGRTPKNAWKSDSERQHRKLFRGVSTTLTLRTLAAVASRQRGAGGAGGPKPKATAGSLPRVPRSRRPSGGKR